MGVRPPTNGGDDDAGGIEFGIAALEPHLETADLSFPATRADVAAALGETAVAYDVHGNTVEVGEILEQVDQAEFSSEIDLLNALHPAFEEYRKRHGRGVIGQVRSLLPF
ncbi:DUF5789 family protein [Natronobiforma cellulositropha]|uniref:DUF5789 family protein n=1 Tax=Natronobiforma cellulositropha TaxID=1679076 RepID=UPI0021D58A67|nr:hypothetical protein [Natronobiforma cellulositropha]